MKYVKRIVSWSALVALFAIYAASLGSACSASQREKALHASFVTLNAARDGFVKWDDQTQARIVNDAQTLGEGKRALAEHRAARDKLVETFELAYRTLASALVLNDEQSFAAALRAVEAVAVVVRKLE